MILKVIYDAEADVPEALKEFYTEKDGKWLLNRVEGLVSQADVTRLQSALNSEKAEHKTTKTKLMSFGEVTPEQLIEMNTELEELRARTPNPEDAKTVDQRVEQIVNARLAKEKGPLERAVAKLTEENTGLKTQNTELDGTIKRGKIADAVRAAITKAKILPEAADDALMNAERMFELTEDGQVKTKDNVGVTPGIDADVWINDMKEKRPHWWPRSEGGGAGGGGKPGNTGGNNPFGAAAWNKTELAMMIRDNPAKAEQLAKQAGWTNAAEAAMASKPKAKAA